MPWLWAVDRLITPIAGSDKLLLCINQKVTSTGTDATFGCSNVWCPRSRHPKHRMSTQYFYCWNFHIFTSSLVQEFGEIFSEWRVHSIDSVSSTIQWNLSYLDSHVTRFLLCCVILYDSKVWISRVVLLQKSIHTTLMSRQLFTFLMSYNPFAVHW